MQGRGGDTLKIVAPVTTGKQKKEKKEKKGGIFPEKIREAGGCCPRTTYANPVLFKKEINSSYPSERR